MKELTEAFHFLLTLDSQIGALIQTYGTWSYGVLAFILFAETGFIITPFLPGDTLLFAAGIFCDPSKHALNLWITLLVLTVAPLAGDSVNFHVGKLLGPRLFKNEKSKIFNRAHLDRTHQFFEKYGQKTIIVARWVPIVRTFAPFVAGMSQMPYRHFIGYSFVGAFVWVWVCVLSGFFFGAIPVIRDHFNLAMLGMIAVTFTPVFIEFLKHRAEASKEAHAKAAVLAEASVEEAS